MDGWLVGFSMWSRPTLQGPAAAAQTRSQLSKIGELAVYFIFLMCLILVPLARQEVQRFGY